jgi:hypothetical protein
MPDTPQSISPAYIPDSRHCNIGRHTTGIIEAAKMMATAKKVRIIFDQM